MEARKDLIQIESPITMAVAMYSASTEQHDIVVCFLVLYEIGYPHNIIK